MATSLTLRTIAAQSMTLRSVDPVSLTLNAPVAGITPSIDGVPTISGLAKVNQTLTATAATSSGLPTPTDTFQWQRSDDGSTGWANISGAVNTTYTAVSADEGKYLRVVQTATNSVGSATANSASTAQVASAFEYLLDTYSSATAAYSLRLLRSTYSGSAIRVRRSDDNEEQDIGFRNDELDTSTLETFSLGSDCFVTTWYDQSEDGNNATQLTASRQPKIVSNGTTITENGKPILENVGGSCGMDITSITTLSSNAWVFSSVVAYSNALFISDNSSNPWTGFSVSGNGSNGKNNGISAYANGVEFTSYTRGDYYNNLSSQSVFSTNINFSSMNAHLRMGFSSFTMYNTQEFVLYDSNESSNRSGIETNINDFYSIY